MNKIENLSHNHYSSTMKQNTRFARYKWNNQRPAQIRQFLIRLFPLLLILISSGVLAWTYRESELRTQLDENAFKSASIRTVEAVNNYFNPLLSFISSVNLWSSVGEINSVGNPENYISLLQSKLALLGSISSMSLTDASGSELVLFPEQDENNWYIAKTENEQSLSSLRKSAGIEYLSHANDDTRESVPATESLLHISSVYDLPIVGEPGITLSLSVLDPSGVTNFILSLDISLSSVLEKLEKQGAIKDSLIFIFMPSDKEYLFLPLSKNAEDEDLINWHTSLENSVERLMTMLSANTPESLDETLRFRFDTEDTTWLTEFYNHEMGTSFLTIGTLVPLDSLWTSQWALPLQGFFIAILLAAGFLGYRLILDFYEVSRSPGRIERMLTDEIARGESDKLEFKSSLRWDYREERLNKGLEEVIVKSVAAFSNATGGTLLIGVADDGKILGLKKDYSVLKQEGKDFYEIHLRNLLGARYGAGYTSKNIFLDFPVVFDKEICRIRIRRGKQPLFTTVKSKNGISVEKFFLRSGNTSQVLENPSEITNYIISRFSRWGRRKKISES